MVQVTSEIDIPSGDHPSSEKSLGQINMEAFHSEFPDQGEWANWPPKWENETQKGRWEIGATAVRDQVIEECAKIMDAEAEISPFGNTFEHAAEFIRSLKLSPKEAG